MRTVKEISDLTGISVRTLHYYDEIGLLKPTEKSDAGYRLYDDKALETLQQILFFREFDISLKEIKAVLDNPALERNQILQVQRKMLVTKKERMERLIASIDDILKGENKMDFTIFTKTGFAAKKGKKKRGRLKSEATSLSLLQYLIFHFTSHTFDECNKKSVNVCFGFFCCTSAICFSISASKVGAPTERITPRATGRSFS